jgi:hypothetical protein
MVQDRAKRLAAWVAIFAIALQTVFAGFGGGPAIAAPFDPATIICHSAPPDGGPTQPPPATHDDCCSHCILCSSLSMASLPAIDTAQMPPRIIAAKLSPFSAVALFSRDPSGPNLPRGPPSSFV